MILRRLAEAIARQDWFVVILEVLIVVIGIFLGLQVDDWNQQRKDRADEQVFLYRLHDDLMLASEMSARVRDRRLDRLQSILSASDVLFRRSDRDELTDDECTSIGSSNYFNINVSSLSSLDELTGTGRLGIIRDAGLRTALVGFQQASQALANMVMLQSSQSAFEHLPSFFPDLIRVESYFDEQIKEVRAHHTCDLDAMRSDTQFLNKWSANADGYDAYVQDGLLPWIRQFDRVHERLDARLGIRHGDTD